MAMKSLPGQDDQPLRAFCEKHLPKQLKELREAEAASPQPSTATDSQRHEEDEQQEAEAQATKSPIHDPNSAVLKAARAHSSKFTGIGGPPLVPNLIIERILSYIHKTRILKKPLFVIAVAKYWSLKRESRRGAPLLKRLHLEPWTASSTSKQQTDEEKAKKLENLIRLRKDLEKVRMLAELTRKREKEKLRAAQMIQDLFANVLFPYNASLKKLLAEVAHQFRYPVSPNEVPTYYEVVKRPMCWSAIQEKLDNLEYCDAQEFKDDCNLVLDNVMLFHPAGTAPHRSASKMKTAIQPVLAKVNRLMGKPPAQDEGLAPPREEAVQNPEGDRSLRGATESFTSIGDLETNLEALGCLLDRGLIEAEIDYIIPPDDDPVHFLLSFDAGKPKSRPPSRTIHSVADPSTQPAAAEMDDLIPKEEAATGSEEPSVLMDIEEPDTAPVVDLAMDTQTSFSKPASPEASAGSVSLPVKSKSKRGRKPGTGTRGTTRKTSVKRTTPGETELEQTEPPKDPREDIDVEPEDSGVSHAPISMRQASPLPPPEHEPRSTDEAPQPKATSVVPKGEELSIAKAAEIKAKNPRKRKRPTEEVDEEEIEIASRRSSSPHSLKDESLAKRRKRTSSVERETDPPVVTDVGYHDSFLLFNKGWVLPEGSRRRERRVLPPLVRRGHKPSKLSTLVASADGEKGIQVQPSTSEPSPNLQGLSAATTTESDPPQSRPVTPVPEEDRPEAEKPLEVIVPPQSTSAPSEQAEPESELSDLSSAESDQEHQKKKTRSSNRRLVKAAAIDRPVKLQEDTNDAADSEREGSVGEEQSDLSRDVDAHVLYEGGTLVWAKQASFPYFPAVVFEEDDVDQIPPNVLQDKQVYVEQFSEGPLTLVRFYDPSSSWGWIPPSRLKLLGEDRDHFLLTDQRFRTANVKANCRRAYNEAMSEMEKPEDLARR
ncbi:nuA3 HAT complex component nto1 [Tulasnella sp. 427]|nr:nuA3 HAT complex component nto1 [Tulasnella sp. 427]